MQGIDRRRLMERGSKAGLSDINKCVGRAAQADGPSSAVTARVIINAQLCAAPPDATRLPDESSIP
jgi:hypothetical protein